MTIILNGQSHQTTAPNVAALLRELNFPQNGVAVALNGSVAPRAQHETTSIKDDDRIEIIRAVQGG